MPVPSQSILPAKRAHLVHSRAHAARADALHSLNRVRSGQAKGEIRAELDPVVEASVVLGMIRGLVTQWLLDRESIDLQRATRAALEACRRSLRAEPPR